MDSTRAVRVRNISNVNNKIRNLLEQANGLKLAYYPSGRRDRPR